MAAALLIVSWWLAQGTAAPRRIGLDVVGGARGAPNWTWPAAVAVPRGFLELGERLALAGESGVELPAAIVPLWAHADGGPALARVDAAPLPAGTTHVRLEPTRLDPPRLRLVERARDGAREFVDVGSGHSFEVAARSLALRKGSLAIALDFGRAAAFEEGCERRALRGALEPATGPDGGGARGGCELSFDDDSGAPPGSLQVRWSVAPTAEQAEVEVAWRASRDGLVERIVVPGHLLGGSGQLLGGGAEVRPGGGGRRSLRADLAELARADGVPAEGAALRVGGAAGVELAWDDFARARPSALTLKSDGGFELALVGEPIALRAGQVVRRRLALRALRGGAAPARGHLVGTAAAAAPFDAATRRVLGAWKELLARDLLAPARVDDRGCYSTPKGERADGEYDLSGSLFWLGARERDGRWLELAAICARHHVDFDRMAAAQGAAPAGLFFMHGDEHQSGRVEAGHQWIEGVLGLARHDGSIEAGEAARGLLRALDGWRADRDAFAGPERRLAWPLLAAAAALEVADDPVARRLAQACSADLCERQTPAGYVDGDRRALRDGEFVWVNGWVSVGITAAALERAAPFVGGRARTAARRLTEFVAGEALTKEGCAEVLLVEPATGQVVRRQGRCRGGDAALVGAGLLRIGAAEGGFADAGGRLLALALEDLAEPRREAVESFAKLLLALRSIP